MTPNDQQPTKLAPKPKSKTLPFNELIIDPETPYRGKDFRTFVRRDVPQEKDQTP
jgi:hypothetical protein